MRRRPVISFFILMALAILQAHNFIPHLHNFQNQVTEHHHHDEGFPHDEGVPDDDPDQDNPLSQFRHIDYTGGLIWVLKSPAEKENNLPPFMLPADYTAAGLSFFLSNPEPDPPRKKDGIPAGYRLSDIPLRAPPAIL